MSAHNQTIRSVYDSNDYYDKRSYAERLNPQFHEALTKFVPCTTHDDIVDHELREADDSHAKDTSGVDASVGPHDFAFRARPATGGKDLPIRYTSRNGDAAEYQKWQDGDVAPDFILFAISDDDEQLGSVAVIDADRLADAAVNGRIDPAGPYPSTTPDGAYEGEAVYISMSKIVAADALESFVDL